jgi:sulfite reductase (NADPH) flavoprotein alpha-component
VYVQDRLREAGARVWELLQRGAHFYVCGDAGGMAPAVQEALLDIIAQHQVHSQAPVQYLAEKASGQHMS